MMGKKLVTHQTGPEGKEVKKILVTEALDIKSEFYVAITLVRAKEMHVIMVSPEGGVDIEEVDENSYHDNNVDLLIAKLPPLTISDRTLHMFHLPMPDCSSKPFNIL